MGRRGDDARQGREIARSTHLIEDVALAQLIGEGHQIDCDIFFIEMQEGREDLAVGVFVEAGLFEELGGFADGALFDQHGAQHRHLRVKILRGQSLKRCELR